MKNRHNICKLVFSRKIHQIYIYTIVKFLQYLVPRITMKSNLSNLCEFQWATINCPCNLHIWLTHQLSVGRFPTFLKPIYSILQNHVILK